MPISRTDKDTHSPTTDKRNMTALSKLSLEPRRDVIANRIRRMGQTKEAARKTGLSARHTKALRDGQHEPQLDTACALAKADHVIRAKIILDCLPDDLALRTEHLRWDDPDDQVEFHKIVMRSLVNLE